VKCEVQAQLRYGEETADAVGYPDHHIGLADESVDKPASEAVAIRATVVSVSDSGSGRMVAGQQLGYMMRAGGSNSMYTHRTQTGKQLYHRNAVARFMIIIGAYSDDESLILITSAIVVSGLA
jgi:hypothetical protein